jgi:hypothetical protein
MYYGALWALGLLWLLSLGYCAILLKKGLRALLLFVPPQDKKD